MEINNSYSQNSYQSKTSSTKKVDEVNSGGISNTFERLVDKANTNNTDNVKTSAAYYESSNIPSTSSVTYEKPTPVKWEDQLLYPHMQYNYDPDNIIAEINLKKNDPVNYEWRMKLKSATNGNKYDGAPEFEAFVKKWMAKGETEEYALFRARSYAFAGLLDYGKQRTGQIGGDIIPYGYVLPYGDTKQHGFHAINNEPLKNAVLQTLDNLSVGDASELINAIFTDYPEANPISFEKTLERFGIKLDELKKLNPEEHKDDKFTFTGDISLKVGTDSQEYNNFIFDTLIKFFEDKIEQFDYFVENTPPGITNNLDTLKDSVNSLIDNFKKEVDDYNGENNGNK